MSPSRRGLYKLGTLYGESGAQFCRGDDRGISGQFDKILSQLSARGRGLLRIPVDREHRFRLIVNTQSS
jgi:hypothetical protein